MEIGVYGLFTEDEFGGLRDVLGLSQRSGSAQGGEVPPCCCGTSGVCGLFPLSCGPSRGKLGSPLCPRDGSVSVTSSPLESAVWAFKGTFPYPELLD